jgi:hypothetical protein
MISHHRVQSLKPDSEIFGSGGYAKGCRRVVVAYRIVGNYGQEGTNVTLEASIRRLSISSVCHAYTWGELRYL